MRLVFIIFTLFLAGCEFLSNSELPETEVKVGNQTFTVEIAQTLENRRKGLMFRKKMPEDGGMLFIFEEEKRHGFWMKNTFIPLDIVWIDADKKIIDVKTVPPCNIPVCPVYHPDGEAKYVLEVNADALQAGLGEMVDFQIDD